MIIYRETKKGFSRDMLTNNIENIIADQIKEKTGKSVAANEQSIYKQSLGFMDRLLNDSEIPDDAGILIEYHFPQSSMRADFTITGSNGEKECVLIIELKAWTEAMKTNRDGVVETKFRGKFTPTNHPSYQAWSYASLLKFYSATVEDEGILVQPCVYMHNFDDKDDVIGSQFYGHYLEKAPVFYKHDALKLREFIKKHVREGDKTNVISKIENGKIRPGKHLADAIVATLKNNDEFVMIDNQKVVFEVAKDKALHSNDQNKNVIIVKGGPGTGKSVVAINLLAKLVHKGRTVKYVTKTAAPRAVYLRMLKGKMDQAFYKPLFVSSGTFIREPENAYDCLIVDEAHRLTEKSGMYKEGENQIKEIINASKCSIFFIDENQRIHLEDAGTVSEIEKFAKEAGAKVEVFELESQFRCNGSDGYLNWLDNVLAVRSTANFVFEKKAFNYDFKVLTSPIELFKLIEEKNRKNNKSRIVAGYCWEWKSKNDPSQMDIVFPEFGFQKQWNLTSYGSSWLIDSNSINEIGCIHTCQGLDLDYVGVIIGDDLRFENGQVLTDAGKRSKDDRSVKGYKTLAKQNLVGANQVMDEIIKNTYRTLMTRGLKGCYIYCTDPNLAAYFKGMLQIRHQS
ncbi:DUF2075 domain-containing protein [Chitinophaga sp. sic0106]|uniref:DUF2075 domain-containing protein n=1 Tax=Chitinophaga sp. sic0106 TaxID=2854785 RepID=UPI001C45E6F3|nr:DUF2075 domain-containing protein [Chitinophaga sp. sic0106]MBV7529792.1 DUF2075 domain-containing protein [Chitinophaga sp. sic0106]